MLVTIFVGVSKKDTSNFSGSNFVTVGFTLLQDPNIVESKVVVVGKD